MAMRAFEGTWQRRMYSQRDPGTLYSGTPDPAHGDMSESSEVRTHMDVPDTSDGAGEIDTGEIITDNGISVSHNMDKSPIFFPLGPGLQYKVTASERGHGIGGTTDPYSGRPQWNGNRWSSGSREIFGHGQDYGAATAATTEWQPFGPPGNHGQADHETTYSFNDDKNTVQSPMTMGADGWDYLRRGLNSDAINNGAGNRNRPDTIAYGNSSTWRADPPKMYRRRRSALVQRLLFDGRIDRKNEVKYARQNTITPIRNTPPSPFPSKYASPYSTQEQFLPHWSLPLTGVRRQPVPFFETELAQPRQDFDSSNVGYDEVVS